MQLWTMSSLGKTKLTWGNKGVLVGLVGRISPTTFFHTLYFHISKLHRIAKYNCPFNPFTTESFNVFETFSAYTCPIEKLSDSSQHHHHH